MMATMAARNHYIKFFESANGSRGKSLALNNTIPEYEVNSWESER